MQKPTNKNGSKLIRLNQKHFDQKRKSKNNHQIKGDVIPISSSMLDKSQQDDFITLVWLFCPHCNSLEYSSVLSQSGRVHNLCGNNVLEKQVKLVAQVEYDITQYNIPNLNQALAIKTLDKALTDSIKNFHTQMSSYAKIVQKTATKELRQFDYQTLLKRIKYYVDAKKAVFDHLGIAHSMFFINSQSLFDKN